MSKMNKAKLKAFLQQYFDTLGHMDDNRFVINGKFC